ncbi:hypothetical protein ARMSODRAFT_329801 [Armillaria solidipes]|uniref:Uncharacterized protein n=1 Tax=Armillaria solidipes TaxID=1076256 RepID=A0A2H3BIM1_9AGAR|nr:hypothetical protein ARMSODRAFT_329801 [Armillaria solidipes]
MRLFTTFSFLLIWTFYFLLGECRPYGLLECRAPRYTKGDKITIKVKSSTTGLPKNKEYECTVMCRVCEKVVRLGTTNTYTLGPPWDRHKKSYRGSRIRRGCDFDVSAVLSNIVGVAKADMSVVKDLMSSDIMEAMEERFRLMVSTVILSLVTVNLILDTERI